MYAHLTSEQDCYDEHGHCFIFMEAIASGAVVRQVFEGYQGDSCHVGEPVVFTKALFAEEVTPKLSASVAKLQSEATELREELGKLKQERLEAQRIEQGMFKTLKNHAAVRDLVEFINGGFKYLAYRHCSGWRIQPIEDAVKDDSERGRPSMRLLSLYGQSKGDMSWRLHQYSDGSGNSYSDAQPTRTLEDAQEFVKQRLLLEVKESTEQYFVKGDMLHLAEKLRDQMVGFGIDVPPHIAELADAYKASSKTKNIERLESEIAKKQDELAKAKGE